MIWCDSCTFKLKPNLAVKCLLVVTNIGWYDDLRVWSIAVIFNYRLQSYLPREERERAETDINYLKTREFQASSTRYDVKVDIIKWLY